MPNFNERWRFTGFCRSIPFKNERLVLTTWAHLGTIKWFRFHDHFWQKLICHATISRAVINIQIS